MLATYFDVMIRPSVEKLEKTLGIRKQINIVHVPTENKFVKRRADYFDGWELHPVTEWEYSDAPF